MSSMASTTESDAKLLQQIEFYFGDANLPFDKFIKKESALNEGWFPLTTLLKFNRVRQLTEGCSSDEERLKQIVDVLRRSVLVEINEPADKIRRNPEVPLPEGNSEDRTVYIKGFHRTETKLDQLIEFFKKYEGFEAVIMRYYKEKVLVSTPKETSIKTEGNATSDGGEKSANGEKNSDTTTVKSEPKEETKKETDATEAKVVPTEDKIVWQKKFKGSIFVVFKTPEQANKLAADEFTYPGNQGPYIQMTQRVYKGKKQKEYEERKEARANKEEKGANGKAKKEEKEHADEKTDSEPLRDVLVRILTIPEGFSRETLKDKWYAVAPEDEFRVAFVDFQRGDTSGVLRLEREGAAKEAIEKLGGKLALKEEVTSVIEGFEPEAEKVYNQKIAAERAKLKRKSNRGGGRGRGGKRRRY